MKETRKLAEGFIESLEDNFYLYHENKKLQGKIDKVRTLLKEFDYDKNDKESIKYLNDMLYLYLSDDVDFYEEEENE